VKMDGALGPIYEIRKVGKNIFYNLRGLRTYENLHAENHFHVPSIIFLSIPKKLSASTSDKESAKRDKDTGCFSLTIVNKPPVFLKVLDSEATHQGPTLAFIDSTEKEDTINQILRHSFGPRCRSRPRLVTASDFNNKKELMAIMQVTERPIYYVSSPCQSFNWFGMVDPKSSINT